MGRPRCVGGIRGREGEKGCNSGRRDNLKRGPRLKVGGEQRMGGRAREIKTIHMFRVELEPESCFGLTASGRKGDSPQVHTSNA